MSFIDFSAIIWTKDESQLVQKNSEEWWEECTEDPDSRCLSLQRIRVIRVRGFIGKEYLVHSLFSHGFAPFWTSLILAPLYIILNIFPKFWTQLAYHGIKDCCFQFFHKNIPCVVGKISLGMKYLYNLPWKSVIYVLREINLFLISCSFIFLFCWKNALILEIKRLIFLKLRIFLDLKGHQRSLKIIFFL